MSTAITMNDKYRILYLEDVSADFEMVVCELKKSRIDFELCIATCKNDYLRSLTNFSPDIILCNHSLSSFSGFEAIKIAKEKKPGIPFILITATMNEDVAMTVVKESVADYILKDRLKRLPYAVINAIEKYRFENESRQQIDKAKEALSKNVLSDISNKLLLTTKVAGIGIWEYYPDEKKIISEDVLFSLYNTTPSHFDGSYEMWMSFIHPDDRERVNEEFTKAIKNHSNFKTQFRIIWNDGSVRFIESVAFIQDLRPGNFLRLTGTNQDITERKRAEQVIKEGEEKYHSFFNNSMDGILLAAKDGSIITANPAACDMFRMSEEEICTAGRSGLMDGTDDRFTLLIKEREQFGKAKGEITLVRKDGSTFPGEVTSAMYRNANDEGRICMIIRDVTEKKKAEEKLISTSQALQQALNDLHKIMNTSLDVICSINEEGEFVNVNAASENIWGYTPCELKGKKYIDLVFNEDTEHTTEIARAIFSGIPVTMFENRYRRKDGKILPMLWSAIWDENDKLVYCVGKDATGIKRLENALEAERQRFYEFFLHAPCSLGILKGHNHVFEMANSVYLQLTGRKDIIGKTAREVFPELENQGLFDLLHYVYTTGNSYVANERLLKVNKKDGGEPEDVYLNFVYQAYRNAHNEIEGIFFFAVDVTEQVQSRKKIEESEKRFRQIVETAQEGIWRTDENNKTVFVNQKTCDILEYPQEEMMGKTVMFFKDEQGGQESLKRLMLREQRVNETHESKFITKSGRHIWTIVSTNPIFNEEGQYKGGLAMITDITTRKEQELQIQKNSEEREMLIAELTKSIKDLKQFTYITSHNFRAPLSNLIALLDLLDYSNLSDYNKEVIEMFKASTHQLNKTINDLMQILIIKNNVNVNVNDNDISELLSEVCHSLAHEINETGCIINMNIKVENIRFSRTYLHSILMNLLSNAIKYRSPKRPLKINIATTLQAEGEVLLTICDNGLGIDLTRHSDNIFGLYQRFHCNPHGTGFGLFMVKSQITALGGSIKVESEVDKGTTFYITFKG